MIRTRRYRNTTCLHVALRAPGPKKKCAHRSEGNPARKIGTAGLRFDRCEEKGRIAKRENRRIRKVSGYRVRRAEGRSRGRYTWASARTLQQRRSLVKGTLRNVPCSSRDGGTAPSREALLAERPRTQRPRSRAHVRALRPSLSRSRGGVTLRAVSFLSLSLPLPSFLLPHRAVAHFYHCHCERRCVPMPFKDAAERGGSVRSTSGWPRTSPDETFSRCPGWFKGSCRRRSLARSFAHLFVFSFIFTFV